MLPIKTIVHPTDFSEHAEYAFRVACALARDYGARLIVVHVMSPLMYNSPEMGPLIPDQEMVDDELLERLQSLRPGDPAVVVDYRLCHGETVEEITGLAKLVKGDLLVMGTHGRKGVGRLLMGSIAEAVLRRAHCPVLTLKVPFPSAASPTPPRPAEPAHA
jgi:nucleotide-binding universal stress UspA family protein